MARKIYLFLLILLCTIFVSVAQVFYKLAVGSLKLNIISIITNYYLITGLFLYGLGSLFLLFVLKYGELSTYYPIISLGYVFVSFLSQYFFHETISAIQWAGILLIILGVGVMGIGAKNEDKR